MGVAIFKICSVASAPSMVVLWHTWGPGNPNDFVLVHPRVVHGKVDPGHRDLMIRAVQLRE